MDKDKIKNHAAIIVKNNKLITALWQDIDHYKNHNSSVQQEQKVLKRIIDDMSLGQIVTACFTLPPYITKFKQKLSKMEDGETKTRLEQELKLKEQELEEIKSLRE